MSITELKDPNKQEYNIHYQKYDRDENNQDENKRRNIYRSHTKHSREQQENNRSPKQENFKSVINFQQKYNND